MQIGVLDSLLCEFTAYLFPVSATKCLLYMVKRKECESKWINRRGNNDRRQWNCTRNAKGEPHETVQPVRALSS